MHSQALISRLRVPIQHGYRQQPTSKPCPASGSRQLSPPCGTLARVSLIRTMRGSLMQKGPRACVVRHTRVVAGALPVPRPRVALTSLKPQASKRSMDDSMARDADAASTSGGHAQSAAVSAFAASAALLLLSEAAPAWAGELSPTNPFSGMTANRCAARSRALCFVPLSLIEPVAASRRVVRAACA